MSTHRTTHVKLSLLVSSRQHALEELIRLIGMEPTWESSHDRGEPRGKRGTFDVSMWRSAPSVDGDDIEEQWRTLEPAAKAVSTGSGRFAPDITAEIEFVVFSYAYVTEFEIPLWLAKASADAGLPIRVTVYPCSDD